MNCTDVDQPASLACLKDYFLPNLITSLMAFAGISAVIFIILGGIKFITSGGDEYKVSQAKRTLTFSIIGLVVVVMSYAIIRTLQVVLGVGSIWVK